LHKRGEFSESARASDWVSRMPAMPATTPSCGDNSSLNLACAVYQDDDAVPEMTFAKESPTNFAGALPQASPRARTTDKQAQTVETESSPGKKRGSVVLPPLHEMTAEEQMVIKSLDSDGDGQITLSEVIAGVKMQVETGRQIKRLQKRQIWLVAGVTMLVGLASLTIFGLSLAASPRPPPPAVCSAGPATTTPEQAATVQVVQAICLQLSAARSRAARADLLGGFVRLAFHDAGSFDGATGGADGCVDLSAGENRGLGPIIDSLASVVQSVSGTLSRADVWALSSAVAVEAAGGPQLTFSFGRVDSDSCTGHGSRHPSAEINHASIRAIFVDRLGFLERDVAALMGAHVLGRAVPANSGYDGAWVPNNDRFTNQFFRDLLVVPWNKVARPSFNGEARTQWNGRGNTMMLNTDIEIAFDTSTGCNRAGGNGGGRGRCPRASHGFSDAVTEFAVNQGAFFEAFAPAFQSLLALGSSSLQCAFPDCSTPGPL